MKLIIILMVICISKIECKPRPKFVNSVPCPGGASCPDQTTCCQLSSGQWGCCPLPNATCCSDHLHCCPNGYQCDVKDSKCIKGDTWIPIHVKIMALRNEKQNPKDHVNAVPCPSGSSECPDGNTCCQIKSGEWGCCPLVNATCCSDHEHCCPSGYKCDVADSRCIKGNHSIPFYNKKIKSKLQENKNLDAKTIPCPGGSSECPDKTTCCQIKNGEWGCCPMENAVCCSDEEHCCPNGYKCDLKDSCCIRGQISIPFFTKLNAIKINSVKHTTDVLCTDGASKCPNGTTCCEMTDHQMGCCQHENAVCCDDEIHCCPSGYVCNTDYGSCNKGTVSIPFSDKLTAAVKLDNNQKKASNYSGVILCQDGYSYCPPDYTCCLLSNKQYGCCPVPNGVCCEDYLHCCPQNTKCDMQGQRCISEDGERRALPWLPKVTAKLLIKEHEYLKVPVAPTLCDDGKTTCDPFSSCCKMFDGSFGCCEFDDGICCTEATHCCPKNTKCGKVVGECFDTEFKYSQVQQEPLMLNWHRIEKEASILNSKEKSRVYSGRLGSRVCPGGELDCDGTCCQRNDTTYACCPYENGTCCGIHGYCCPHGYKCDPKKETCTLKKDNTDLLNVESVLCEDMVHRCPNTYTCCPYRNGGFGCCPVPNAVCCEDRMYCCPQNFKCQVNPTNSTLQCIQDDIILNAMIKVPSF